jgi:hypothetical protein
MCARCVRAGRGAPAAGRRRIRNSPRIHTVRSHRGYRVRIRVSVVCAARGEGGQDLRILTSILSSHASSEAAPCAFHDENVLMDSCTSTVHCRRTLSLSLNVLIQPSSSITTSSYLVAAKRRAAARGAGCGAASERASVEIDRARGGVHARAALPPPLQIELSLHSRYSGLGCSVQHWSIDARVVQRTRGG